ncbi:MAG: trypsin-like peptidase domain-containing protein [Pseudomonadota bacterium]
MHRLITDRLLAPLCLLWLAFPSFALADSAARWSDTVSRVADSVVSISISRQRAFDDDRQGGTSATGFVVDAERGILLTNRHVIGSGPVRAFATFQNMEEIELVPLYRDPVHDYGFFKYDPAQLQYNQPRSLSLHPEGARRGLDIRVIGSDGGEQLSILAGTIARLDRAAPRYGRYGFSDFNTFYYQAASGTSGGSSGSPVVDIEGHVVALNAGANSNTASSFFLPLWRIREALNRLQADLDVARGGLQTVFRHEAFRTVLRLGVPQEEVAQVRAAGVDNTGMLVVEQVFPEGVADGVLRAGDVLVAIEQQPVYQFAMLDSVLDGAVGERVGVTLYRQGERVEEQLDVADLHAAIPNRLVEFGGAVLHDMTLHQARTMNLPRRGVALASTRFMFQRANMPVGAVITSVNEKPVTSIDDLLPMLAAAADGERWIVRFVVPRREYTSELTTVTVDREWHRESVCERRDGERDWACESLPRISVKSVSERVSAQPVSFDDPLLEKLGNLLVRVDFDAPHLISNAYASNFRGTGLIVSPAEGLVLIDRNTVTVSLGEAWVTVFGSLRLPAEVVYLHPVHNIALLKVDPNLLPVDQLSEPVLSAEPEVDASASNFVGFGHGGEIISRSVGLPTPRTLVFDRSSLPRFTQAVFDSYDLQNPPPSLGGVLVSSDAVVHAFWTSFAFQEGRDVAEGEWGFPADMVLDAIEDYRKGEPYHAIDVDWRYLPLSDARELGLNAEQLAQLAALSPRYPRALYVRQVYNVGRDASLQVGDVLLAVGGEPVNALRTLERASQRESVALTVVRAGQAIELDYKTQSLDGTGANRRVSWNGLSVQDPSREVRARTVGDPAGVYVSHVESGSPALADGLYRNRLITAINNAPIGSLDDFKTALRDVEAGDTVRFSTHALNGRKGLVAVESDPGFWPRYELQRNEKGRWQRLDW